MVHYIVYIMVHRYTIRQDLLAWVGAASAVRRDPPATPRRPSVNRRVPAAPAAAGVGPSLAPQPSDAGEGREKWCTIESRAVYTVVSYNGGIMVHH